MTADRADIVDQAIGWHMRLAEADEGKWADFIAWLEADPDHAAVYDRVAADDRLLGQVAFPAPALEARNDNVATRRWVFAGAGIAAAVALAAIVRPVFLQPDRTAYVVATGNGERHTVSLDDGTKIELAGGSAVRLDRADNRAATLERGEAVFHVRHDAIRPFTVRAGDAVVRDLGTVFNVAVKGDHVNLAVAEGAVMFRPEREAIRLGPGDALAFNGHSGAVERTRVAVTLVGGWRNGLLSFENARVGDVVASLTRLYGTEFTLAPDLSARPFTGMVRFTGVADRDVPHLAKLIGAASRREGNRWILSGNP